MKKRAISLALAGALVLFVLALAGPVHAANISGTVMDSNGNAIDGTVTPIYVTAFQGDPCGYYTWIGSIQTDANGVFSITGLPDGVYYLRAENGNQSDYVNEWWNGGDDPSDFDCAAAVPVTVSGSDVTGKDFRLDTGASVSGTVSDAAANPINGDTTSIWVTAYSGDPCGQRTWLGNDQIDSSGAYAIRGLPDGTFYLTSERGDESNYVNEWWTEGDPDPSHYDCSLAQSISVSGGDALTGRDFRLDTGGGISGTVYEESGVTPVNNMHVYAEFFDTFQWMAGVNTDENGDYTLRGLPSGDYRVRTCASCSGLLYLDETYDNATDQEATEVPVTAPDDTPNIDFTLTRFYPRDTVTEAVGDGVAWLAATQAGDGSWGTQYALAKTGLAVLNLEKYAADEAYASPFNESYAYHTHVEKGLDYLFAHAYTVNIGPQSAGDPDGDGDGKGVYFDLASDQTHTIYNTSIAMMAIAASTEPGRVVNVPGSAVDGWTYQAVLQDAVDYLAWAQTDPGGGRGGWNYNPMNNNGDRSDESNSGWVTLALAYAEAEPPEGFGLDIPGFVRMELDSWIDFIQDPVNGDDNDGGAHYSNDEDPPNVNMLKTGNLIQQMAYVGDTAAGQRVRDAVDYLVRHWGWGSPADYHTTYTVMKGLAAINVNTIGPGGSIDWFQDLSDAILSQQLQDGSWPVSSFDDGDSLLSTNWALLTLQKAQVTVPKPDLVIEGFEARWVDEGAGTYTVSFTIRNRGNAEAPAGHDVVLTRDGAVIEGKEIGIALAPGASHTDSFTTVLTLSDATDDVTICADQNDETDELIEDNNCLGFYWPPSMTGVVTDSGTGDPIPGGVVHVYTPDLDLLDTAVTDANGEFEILNLPQGGYWVSVLADGYVQQFSDGHPFLGQADTLNMTPGTTLTVNFSLTGGAGSISGTVYRADGTSPLGNARVWAYVAATGMPAAVTTAGPDGAYTIAGLLAGDYKVKASGAGMSEWYQGAISQEGATPVTVAESTNVTGIDFTLEENGLSGAVYYEDGRPIPDACVSVYSGQCWGNWAGGAQTDATGQFRITGLPDGKYYIFVDHACGGSSPPRNIINEWWDGKEGTEDCNGAKAVVLASGEERPHINFALKEGFHITGSIMNVRLPDGTFQTNLEIMIGNDFVGTLPGDIASITVLGPSGVLPVTKADFTYISSWKDFFIALPGSPENGVYTFTVTAGDAVGTEEDHQYVNRTLPIPDSTLFSPGPGEVVSSRTPSFSWAPVDFPGAYISYRLEITDMAGNRVYATSRQPGMTYYTIPKDILNPGQAYKWRVRATDNADWVKVQNRADSEWATFSMADPLGHGAVPAIDLDSFGVVTWTTANGTGALCEIKVVDHDGVSSDASSHQVTVTTPGGANYNLTYDGRVSPTCVYYYCWINTPQAGDYTFNVTDPDGNPGESAVDTLEVNPLPPPDEASFTPSLKNPVNEYITATFDNVYVNGVLYDDFDGYASIGDLDYSKWRGPYSNGTETIESGKYKVHVGDVVGRGNSHLGFEHPQDIHSISADVTVENASSADRCYARIAGYFFNKNGNDVQAKVLVWPDRVAYSVTDDILGETVSWTFLARGQLKTVTPGQSVRASISWDGTTLTFRADDQVASYTPEGPVYPAVEPGRMLQVRVDLTASDSTPAFTLDPVSGANQSRARIYNYDNSRTLWKANMGSEAGAVVPPGVLSPNAMYRYRMDAWDAHSPLDIDNWSRTPASNNDNYQFYTGEVETVEPFIEFDSQGVRTWSGEGIDSYLSFWIKVYDAQGVPGDIASVTVEFPGGHIEPLYHDPREQRSPTCAIYRNNYHDGIESGTYVFRVEDRAGHVYTVSEDLTVNPIGYPAADSLSAVVNGTAVDFDWADVPDRAFYRVQIYDQDYNRIYAFPATESQYHLAAGFLKAETLYRYLITTWREYFDQNVDNGSSSPWDFSAMPTFVTAQPTASGSPAIDLDNWGAATLQTGDQTCWLAFRVKVSHPDGVPAHIASVTVTFPDGATTRELYYDEGISSTEAYYEFLEGFDDPVNIPEGTYTFTVTDSAGHPAQVADVLVKNILPAPANCNPVQDSLVLGATPTIQWDDVTGASGYRVRIYDGGSGTLHWSDYLALSEYTVPEGVLDLDRTYSYRVYAYREAYPGSDLDNASVNNLYTSERPHFTVLTDVGTVSGEVTVSIAGHPDLGVAGATVSLDGTGISTTTDGSGHFVLENVPAGTYTLRIEATGFDPVTRSVTVNAGEELVVSDIPEPVISGTQSVWDADGDGQLGLSDVLYGLQVLSGKRD